MPCPALVGLAAWTRYLLVFAGRLQAVKSLAFLIWCPRRHHPGRSSRLSPWHLHFSSDIQGTRMICFSEFVRGVEPSSLMLSSDWSHLLMFASGERLYLMRFATATPIPPPFPAACPSYGSLCQLPKAQIDLQFPLLLPTDAADS